MRGTQLACGDTPPRGIAGPLPYGADGAPAQAADDGRVVCW